MSAQKVLEFFKAMNQIPRGSGNEKAVSDWLVEFAKARNLEVEQDEANNVLIRKAATPGFENRPSIILQGHMDMVCEKSDASTHDFLTDPIEHIEEGEWLHSNETTLGADNGIAVAMSLAVLDSDSIEHGPLECLFTTSEETGMDGALAVKEGQTHGQYLLNIDTEVEGEFVVSCAGGCRVDVEIPRLRDNRDSQFTHALKLTLNGFLGGHSGIEIHKERANGNQILGRLLYELAAQYNYQLASFTGGTKHNAIPRVGSATILVKESDVKPITTWIQAKMKAYRGEFTPQDENINILVSDAELPDTVYGGDTAESLLTFLYLAPNGVFAMNHSLEGLVETSNNIAIVEETEHTIHLLISIRSLSESSMDFLTKKIHLLASTLGLPSKIAGSYPAWEYEPGSPLEEQAITIYEKVTSQKPKVTAIHAGLECGLLKAVMPNTQMISFGPTITHAHTPQERLHLPSVEHIFDYLKVLLKELK